MYRGLCIQDEEIFVNPVSVSRFVRAVVLAILLGAGVSACHKSSGGGSVAPVPGTTACVWDSTNWDACNWQ